MLLNPFYYADERNNFPSLPSTPTDSSNELETTDQAEQDDLLNHVHQALFPPRKKKVKKTCKLPTAKSTDSDSNDYYIISSDSEGEDQNNNMSDPRGNSQMAASKSMFPSGSRLPWPGQHPLFYPGDPIGPQRTTPQLTRRRSEFMPVVYRDLDSHPQYEGLYRAHVSGTPLAYGFHYGLRQVRSLSIT